jgi:hypothetical protein
LSSIKQIFKAVRSTENGENSTSTTSEKNTCVLARAVESVQKLPTPTPQFLKLQLVHKISIHINNGKPIRHFITTT